VEYLVIGENREEGEVDQKIGGDHNGYSNQHSTGEGPGEWAIIRLRGATFIYSYTVKCQADYVVWI